MQNARRYLLDQDLHFRKGPGRCVCTLAEKQKHRCAEMLYQWGAIPITQVAEAHPGLLNQNL